MATPTPTPGATFFPHKTRVCRLEGEGIEERWVIHRDTRWPGTAGAECQLSHDNRESDDPVNLPDHYTKLPVECIDVTEHFNFTLGNAIKYIWRADHKGKPIEDLKKAVWYLEREIKRRESL